MEKQSAILRLTPEAFSKCANIWDLNRDPLRTRKWYGELLSGDRITWVWAEGDAYVGEISLVLRNDDPDYTIPGRTAYLSRLIVRADHRRRGIGEALSRYLLSQAGAMGYTEVSVGVDRDNAPARALYRKLGFCEVLFEGEDAYGPYSKLLRRL